MFEMCDEEGGERRKEKNIGIKSFKGKRKLAPPPSKETLGFFPLQSKNGR